MRPALPSNAVFPLHKAPPIMTTPSALGRSRRRRRHHKEYRPPPRIEPPQIPPRHTQKRMMRVINTNTKMTRTTMTMHHLHPPVFLISSCVLRFT